MKARVKETGEIIEVSRHSGVLDETNQRIYNWYEVETIDAHFADNYWDKLLHQYAGMAMQGILSNESIMCELDVDGVVTKDTVVADMAVTIATTLVNKFKGDKV